MGALQCLSAQLCRARQDKRTHVGPYLSDLCCVVIGQYAIGRSLMDRSILFSLKEMATRQTRSIFSLVLFQLPVHWVFFSQFDSGLFKNYLVQYQF